jgi:hypothetical protein
MPLKTVSARLCRMGCSTEEEIIRSDYMERDVEDMPAAYT